MSARAVDKRRSGSALGDRKGCLREAPAPRAYTAANAVPAAANSAPKPRRDFSGPSRQSVGVASARTDTSRASNLLLDLLRPTYPTSSTWVAGRRATYALL